MTARQDSATRGNANEPAAVVLLLCRERALRTSVRVDLCAHGYRVIEATRASEAMGVAATGSPDIVLVDLDPPHSGGSAVIVRIREWTPVPLIAWSADPREAFRVEALDAGADDCLARPPGLDELRARIRVHLRRGRRPAAAAPAVYFSGSLVVDVAARRVEVDGIEVRLTKTEYDLLVVLVRNAGIVVPNHLALRSVWGAGTSDRSNYVRVYMARLRQKLRCRAGAAPIETLPGVGYRLRSSAPKKGLDPRSAAPGGVNGSPGRTPPGAPRAARPSPGAG